MPYLGLTSGSDQKNFKDQAISRAHKEAKLQGRSFTNDFLYKVGTDNDRKEPVARKLLLPPENWPLFESSSWQVQPGSKLPASVQVVLNDWMIKVVYSQLRCRERNY